MNNLFRLGCLWIILLNALVSCQTTNLPEIQTTSATPSRPVKTENIPIVTIDSRPFPQSAEPTLYKTPPLSIKGTVTPPSVEIPLRSGVVNLSPAYFEGFIVLTRYYTLLDRGFFFEAVSSYTKSKQQINGIEAEVNYFEQKINGVEIVSIRPFNYWLVEQGLNPQQDPVDEIRFVVGTIVYLKGQDRNIAGTPVGTREPDHSTSFVSLISEEGEWKIEEINSSPWLP